jgi:uncharacterized membrane protein
MNLLGRPWLHFLLLAALAFWVSWLNLGSAYLGDDFAYVARFIDFPWAQWPSLFVNEWSGGMWQMHLPELRPMAALSFMIDGRLFGADPLGSHITNMVLHLGGGLWVYRLTSLVSRETNPKAWLPLLAAALFLLSPSHAEPVAWVTGRVDSLAAFFYLGALASGMMWIKSRSRLGLVMSWLCFAAGVFSKEFVMTAPLLLSVWVVVVERKSTWQFWKTVLVIIAGFLGIFILYLICRHTAFGSSAGTPVSADLFRTEFLWRQVRYAAWLIPPFVGDIGEGPSGKLLLIVVSMLGLGALCVRKFYREKRLLGDDTVTLWGVVWAGGIPRIVLFGAIWYLIATLPLVVTYFSPRHLYLASAGTSITLAMVIAACWSRRTLAISLALFALVSSGLKTRQEGIEWMRTGKISARISAALASAQTERPAGTAILLNVPANNRGMHLWSWATPFALKPPFFASEITAVYETPPLYVAPHNWAQQKDWAALAGAEQVWFLRLDEKSQMQRRELDRDRVRAALPVMRAKFSSQDPGQAWLDFLSEVGHP